MMILVALTAVLAVACSVEHDYSGSHGHFSYYKNKYAYYPEDVVDKCMTRPLEVIHYVDALYKSSSKKLTPGSYVVEYGGVKYGPLKFEVVEKDTVWTFDEVKYAIGRDLADKSKWVVVRDDEQAGHGFTYQYVLTAVNNVENNADSCWTVTLEGTRLEGTDYSMAYNTEGEFRYVDGGSERILDGTVYVSFIRKGKELDWIRTSYDGNVTKYEMSFEGW